MKPRLRVAACQFPVTADVGGNARWIQRLIRRAAKGSADIVHFPEAALSGYGGVHFRSFARYDWERLREATREIQELAARLGVFVLLGSAHDLGPGRKPTNCLYLIDRRGRIRDRYDKRMLTDADREVYTPGRRLVTATLGAIRCGFLICYDGCYPQTYAAYRREGVELMFHSFHNAGFRRANILDEYKPALIRIRAADNRLWVVATNSSRAHSSWATCIARPDGSLCASLKRHVPGVLFHDFPDSRLKGWIHTRPQATR